MLVFEATSLSDGLILRLASAAGQPFARINPLHGWHFGRSLNLPRTDRLKRVETQERNRMRKNWSRRVRDDIRATLQSLTRRRGALEAAIEAFLRIGPALARHADCCRASPASAASPAPPCSPDARARSARPPRHRLARRPRPRARERGKWRGQRRTGNGRRHVRHAPYMAAPGTLRRSGAFGQQAGSMRGRGKPGKAIATAIARKTLIIANAIVRDQTP